MHIPFDGVELGGLEEVNSPEYDLCWGDSFVIGEEGGVKTGVTSKLLSPRLFEILCEEMKEHDCNIQIDSF